MRRASQDGEFHMKFRRGLESGSCSGKHLNVLLVPAVLRTVLNIKHRLKSQVFHSPQHVLKCFPHSKSQNGGKSVADSRGSTGKGSH